MARPEVKDYRITVTPEAARRGGHTKLLKDLKAVGFRVTDDNKTAVAGLIPTTKLDALAAVAGISLQLNEDFQISPVESQAT